MSTLMVARFQHVREENEISISVQRLKEEATRMSKGEFMQLIPCSQMTSLATSSHSNHTKDSSDLIQGHGAQHWYNAYMALYEQHYKETGDLQVSLDQALEVIKSLQDSLHEKNVEIERLRKKLKKPKAIRNEEMRVKYRTRKLHPQKIVRISDMVSVSIYIVEESRSCTISLIPRVRHQRRKSKASPLKCSPVKDLQSVSRNLIDKKKQRSPGEIPGSFLFSVYSSYVGYIL